MRLVLVLAPGPLVASACPSLDPFACLGDEQCTLMADGVCHSDNGACSYPDGECDSGHRWSQTAGALAGTCVEGEAATTTSTSAPTSSSDAASSADASSTSGPIAECGNGVVEGDEECDRPDAKTCDDCTSDCRLAGQLRWSATHDGGMGYDDFFDSVLIDPTGDVIAVGRAGSGPAADAQDRLIVRYDAEGQVRWVMEETSAGRDDLNCVLLGPRGEIIAGGVRQSAAGIEELWVGRYDEGVVETLLAYAEYEPLATVGNDCVFTSDGRLVVGGLIDGGGEAFEKWDRLVLDDALGPAPQPFVIRGTAPEPEARDILYALAVGPDDNVLAAGNITRALTGPDRWIASFDAAGMQLDEYIEAGAGMGPEEVFGLVVDGDMVFAAGSNLFNSGGTERTWVAGLSYDGLTVDWDVQLPLDPPVVVTDITLDADGDLLVVANRKGIGGALAKLDRAGGECQWLVLDPGGARKLGEVVVAPDGGLVIVGGDVPEDPPREEAPGDALVASLLP